MVLISAVEALARLPAPVGMEPVVHPLRAEAEAEAREHLTPAPPLAVRMRVLEEIRLAAREEMGVVVVVRVMPDKVDLFPPLAEGVVVVRLLATTVLVPV